MVGFDAVDGHGHQNSHQTLVAVPFRAAADVPSIRLKRKANLPCKIKSWQANLRRKSVGLTFYMCFAQALFELFIVLEACKVSFVCG